MTPGAEQATNDIIFVSLEPWDEVWRRNQFFCAALARRKPFRRILFVGPAVDMSAAVRRGRPDEMCGRETCRLSDLPNVTVTRPAKWLPNRTPPARWTNQAVVRRHVRREGRRLGFYDDARRPLLWLNPYYAAHMIGRMGEVGVVYDITDDWTHFKQDGRLRRQIVQQDQQISDRADAIIVCSEALEASKRPYAHKVHLIKNGVDCRHYAAVLTDAALPDAASTWERPVFGYTGTVHRDRLDVALVEQVAQRMNQGTVALIGPSHLNERERRRLTKTGRVVMTGAVPYAKVPDYMRAFDVCIVPHRVTPFTESLNPIKLWEYLASGKPIVSTPVAGFRDFPQFVRLAPDSAGFLAAAHDAALENGVHAAARQHLAAGHSWASRVEQVEAVLQGVVAAAEAPKP